MSGDALLKIVKRKELLEEFMKLADNMSAVLACRVSPKQKAELVNLVK